MEAVKVMGTIDERGQLTLDQPLELVENSRVEVIILVQDSLLISSEEDTPKEEVLADLRQAWREAMTGQAIPVAQLWEDFDNE
ncbi:hypothetical protein [Nodosilinea sp. E11]|uniref:type II toxin-antitoxin system RelN family antitoxin n=1 Tax=Nodosilinea sp. E11 TaxID=3037479 RepID=UPI002934802F|nr:hypothetical protein [Nodosilinea sp. E11]WOD40434.1 hypothetical protein RRF56_06465 [Nodosilinea sp. E11]